MVGLDTLCANSPQANMEMLDDIVSKNKTKKAEYAVITEVNTANKGQSPTIKDRTTQPIPVAVNTPLPVVAPIQSGNIEFNPKMHSNWGSPPLYPAM